MGSLAPGSGLRPRRVPSCFPILDLPSDIVGVWCDRLCDADLFHVRLACRSLERLSTSTFGRRFFTHLVAILHPLSLAMLADIACCAKLSNYVRQVTISGIGSGGSEVGSAQRPTIAASPAVEATMIADAFKDLPNLTRVHVDACSFFDRSCTGIRCGRRLIRSRGGIEAPRVYGVVLGAVCEAGTENSVKITLALPPSYRPVDAHFELRSSWFSRCSAAIQAVQSTLSVNTQWHQQLLCSLPNLESLALVQSSWSFDWGAFEMHAPHWPNLCFLRLDQVALPQNPFAAFLRRHGDTLSSITLSSTFIPEGGSWEAPLLVLHGMPNLARLRLFELWADSPPPSKHRKREHLSLASDGTRDSALVLGVLCSGMEMMQGGAAARAQGSVDFGAAALALQVGGGDR